MLFARRTPPEWRERMRVALWPRRSFKRSFSYIRHRILRLEGSAHAIAAGVAAGAFASCTPLVGFHFILSFVLAWVIGGSMIAAALGTAVGNPLTFPLIWLSSFRLGDVLLGGSSSATPPTDLDLSFSMIWNSFGTLWPTLKPMFVGGAVIGLVIGTTLYFAVRYAVAMRRAYRATHLADRRNAS